MPTVVSTECDAAGVVSVAANHTSFSLGATDSGAAHAKQKRAVARFFAPQAGHESIITSKLNVPRE